MLKPATGAINMLDNALRENWNGPLFSLPVPVYRPMNKGKTCRNEKPEPTGTKNAVPLYFRYQSLLKTGTEKPEPASRSSLFRFRFIPASAAGCMRKKETGTKATPKGV